MTEKTFAVLALAAGLFAAKPANANVGPGIHAATHTPPPVVATLPGPLVAIPGSAVQYVPAARFNLFAYAGRFYSHHDGAWFFATSHRGPWTLVAAERVPGPVLAVPVTYYKIPPGHAKRLHARGPKQHGKGHDR